MADADGRIIPLVEDDQGEGVKDPLDEGTQDMTEAILRSQVGFRAVEDACNKGTGERLSEILERIDRLESNLKLIFGSHFLLNGKWVKAEKMLDGE